MAMLATDERPAIEILGQHLNRAPVDVHAIVRALGLDLVVNHEMGENSGKIERSSTAAGGYRITINGQHSRTRQRFTIAHEIAHFILHRDLIGDGIVDDALYRSNRGDEIERQANIYAAAILMPAPLVRQKYREGIRSYATMAMAFDVSYQVAEIRMKDLRLA